MRSARAEPFDDDWDAVAARVVIFAQRAKGRPNRIGVTVCRLLSVDGRTLWSRELVRDYWSS